MLRVWAVYLVLSSGASGSEANAGLGQWIASADSVLYVRRGVLRVHCSVLRMRELNTVLRVWGQCIAGTPQRIAHARVGHCIARGECIASTHRSVFVLGEGIAEGNRHPQCLQV